MVYYNNYPTESLATQSFTVKVYLDCVVISTEATSLADITYKVNEPQVTFTF